MNYKVVRNCNKKRISTVYIFHEPYSTFFQYYKKWGSSFKNILKAAGLTFFNGKPLISKISGLILPSKNAYSLFKKNYKGKKYERKKTVSFPLMFGERMPFFGERHYISFIGNVDRIKNFSLFIDYISKSSLDAEFLIATSLSIDERLVSKIKDAGKRVTIFNGKRLSKDEIELLYQQSYAVWLFYKDSTQSGVLPMCYKNGTPVLSSSIPGLAQNVVNKKTGFILDCYDVSVFDSCFEMMINRFHDFQRNVLDYYDKMFIYKNYETEVNKFFMSFFESIDVSKH